MTDRVFKTWMRFEHRVGRDSEDTFFVDKEFAGVSEEDLHLQIRYHCFKTGVWKAYNIELKEKDEKGKESKTKDNAG